MLLVINNVVRCLGHKHGTNCMRSNKTPQNTLCWEKYQLCSKCAKSEKTCLYRQSVEM